MAKKKATIEPEPTRVQTSVINLKGSEAYREWLGGVSKKTHIPASSIVRLALEEWAGRNGHQSPPEK